MTQSFNKANDQLRSREEIIAMIPEVPQRFTVTGDRAGKPFAASRPSARQAYELASAILVAGAADVAVIDPDGRCYEEDDLPRLLGAKTGKTGQV